MTNATTTPDLSLCTPHELKQSSWRWAQQAKESDAQARCYERMCVVLEMLDDNTPVEREIILDEVVRLRGMQAELSRDAAWRRECGFWARGQGR